MAPVRTTISRALVALLTLATPGLFGPAMALAQTAGSPGRVPSTRRATAPLAAAPAFGPAIADGVIYIPLRSGTIAAHRARDGVQLWQVALEAGQPLAAGSGLVFVSTGEGLHALHAADGSVAWRAPVGALAAPLLAHEGWVIALTATDVLALRASDGAVLWTRAASAPAARASIEGNRAYVPLGDGSVRSFDLASGAERWTARLGGPPTEVLAFADRVYVGSADKYFYCLDADGGEIEWRFRVGAALHGKPAADDERIFAASFDNRVRAFDRGHGARRWNSGVPFRPLAGPFVAGSTVIVPGPAAELPAFDAAAGTAAAKLPLGGTLAQPPAVASEGGETVLVALTGDISRGWNLLILDSSFSLTAIPLTSLPGEVVPIALPGR